MVTFDTLNDQLRVQFEKPYPMNERFIDIDETSPYSDSYVNVWGGYNDIWGSSEDQTLDMSSYGGEIGLRIRTNYTGMGGGGGNRDYKVILCH